ncbi:MAG: hypothetical protein ACI9IV_002005, partial [Paracoccaceae bacterium]
MNQVAKIEKSLGRMFCPTHSTIGDELHEIKLPASRTKWVELPKRFIDGITFASRFTGNAKGYTVDRAYIERVNGAHGTVYASDNRTVVEYNIGSSRAFTITPKRIALLKSFGDAPSHMSAEENHLRFKWSSGNFLTFGNALTPTDELTRKIGVLFDAHDWNDFRKMDSTWRDQIVGHFSYKLDRDNDGLIHFAPDRIVGGRSDYRPDTQLSIETHVGKDVTFEQKQLLRAFKVAEEFKFAHGEDASYFLF